VLFVWLWWLGSLEGSEEGAQQASLTIVHLLPLGTKIFADVSVLTVPVSVENGALMFVDVLLPARRSARVAIRWMRTCASVDVISNVGSKKLSITQPVPACKFAQIQRVCFLMSWMFTPVGVNVITREVVEKDKDWTDPLAFARTSVQERSALLEKSWIITHVGASARRSWTVIGGEENSGTLFLVLVRKSVRESLVQMVKG
jgi:hypothetical protein